MYMVENPTLVPKIELFCHIQCHTGIIRLLNMFCLPRRLRDFVKGALTPFSSPIQFVFSQGVGNLNSKMIEMDYIFSFMHMYN